MLTLVTNYCVLFTVEIGFNPTQYQINEQDRRVVFQIENRNPNRSGVYTVEFNTIPGTAVEFTGGMPLN